MKYNPPIKTSLRHRAVVICLALLSSALFPLSPDASTVAVADGPSEPTRVASAPRNGAAPDGRTIPVSPVERVAPGRYRLGEIEVNKGENTISFPAEINMERGMLEYLLVRYGGKMHESLLRTRIEPFNLQLACLLLGMEGTQAPLAFQGAPENPTGDRVQISVRLPGGEAVSPEQWMIQSVEGVGKEAPLLNWIFTGSKVRNGFFAAQVTGSMIAVYHDPAAMIDHASPGGATNGGWLVKEGATPPVGTPVTVVIRAVK